MERKKTGFTTIELLVVLAIISILLGLLVPAVGYIKGKAREVKQSAQFATMAMALETFKNDYGDYPPSDFSGPPFDYCGSQKLAEALVGWDLLGFHPDSHWQADGRNNKPYMTGGVTYSPDKYFFYDSANPVDMDKRQKCYLELATTSTFRLNDLFPGGTGQLNGDRYVICDTYGVKPVPVGGKSFRAGTPILYYRANVSSKQMINNLADFDNNIYNIKDNGLLTNLGKMKDGKPHWRGMNPPDVFYSTNGGVLDPKIAARPWPYRPDSYILISAGADGEYGTGDDITNF